jgi:hypothetical protein
MEWRDYSDRKSAADPIILLGYQRRLNKFFKGNFAERRRPSLPKKENQQDELDAGRTRS